MHGSSGHPSPGPSLEEDRSLCPVRALRYYLDKTQDLRQGKELVFVAFKNGFTKDISPATISSWIKQTVILCYELSDQEALTLHQVKAHDVRAFAASKAFQGGISLDQILAACHWKSHNTFTQFYLKDIAWAGYTGYETFSPLLPGCTCIWNLEFLGRNSSLLLPSGQKRGGVPFWALRVPFCPEKLPSIH